MSHETLILGIKNRVSGAKQIREFFADIVVEDRVIVEVKAVEPHNSAFEAQLLNYLKASGMRVGLLLNFGRSVHVKRMVL